MCGRFIQSQSPERYAERLGAASRIDGDWPANYNVAPRQSAQVVAEHPRTGRVLVPMRWGLIPAWADEASIGNRLINARWESAHHKPAFREAFRYRRALIPAEGFYEWAHQAGAKRPYAVRPRADEPMVLAGLWARWRPDTGADPVVSFTVLTTAADGVVAPLHDRMPVILPAAAWDAWLDPAQTDPSAIRSVRRAGPPMRTYPVSRAVNRPQNNGPHLLEPVEPGSGVGESPPT